jgi:hypothetical protein
MGIDPSQQCLTFNGQKMDDDERKLLDYGVWHQSTVYLNKTDGSYGIEQDSALHLNDVD